MINVSDFILLERRGNIVPFQKNEKKNVFIGKNMQK